MLRPPPRSTRTDTLFPYTTLFRSEPVVRHFSCKAGRLTEFARFPQNWPCNRSDCGPNGRLSALAQAVEQAQEMAGRITRWPTFPVLERFGGKRPQSRRVCGQPGAQSTRSRSEEHKSELQSLMRNS